MGIETILAAVVVAIPVVVVLGTATLLAVGGVIGCAKCVLDSLRSEEPATVREPARQVDARLA